MKKNDKQGLKTADDTAESLAVTVNKSSKDNTWLTESVKKTMTEVVTEGLKAAGLKGKVSITYLRDGIALKNTHQAKLSMEHVPSQSKAPQSTTFVVTGETPRDDLSFVTVATTKENLRMITVIFDSFPGKTFHLEPKAQAPKPGLSTQEQKEVSRRTIPLTPIDDDVGVLFLAEIQRIGPRVSIDSAQAVALGLFPADQYALDGDLIEVMLERRFLELVSDGTMVSMTAVGIQLIGTHGQTKSEAGPTVSESAMRFDELRRKVSDLRIKIEEARGKDATAVLQGAEARKQMGALESSVERKGQEVRRLQESIQVLNAQLAKTSKELESETSRLDSLHEEERRAAEQKKAAGLADLERLLEAARTELQRLVADI